MIKSYAVRDLTAHPTTWSSAARRSWRVLCNDGLGGFQDTAWPGHSARPSIAPAHHQETEYLSITHSHVPSFWRRATSEVTVPLRLRVEVRAKSPQMSAGRCSPSSNFRFSGPNPVTWSFVKNS